MKVPGKLDHFRRRVMRMLTKHIGKTSATQLLSKAETKAIKKILVVRPNHRLGNMLLNTPLIQELALSFPNANIDVLAKGGLAPIILKNYEAVNSFILLPKRPFNELFKYISIWFKMTFKRYDLIVNAVKDSSSGKLLTLITSSKYKVFQNPEDNVGNKDVTHNAKEAICALRTVFKGDTIKPLDNDIPSLNLKLSKSEIKNGKILLGNLVDTSKRTIAIFTFATGGKCYSPLWWRIFHDRLKKDFSNYNILEILPVENVSQIDFEATTYYSKDIREMGAVMSNCDIFIGADSGIMHLASASGVPTIGLFTGRIEQFEPYGNLNCALDTTETYLEDWIVKINEVLDSNLSKKSNRIQNIKQSSVHL